MKKLIRFQLVYGLTEPDKFGQCEFVAEMIKKEVEVISETRHTYVIKDHNGKKRRIYKNARNTYAHKDEDMALRCFYFRTRAYYRVLAGKKKIIKKLLEDVLNKHGSVKIYGSIKG